MWWPLDAAKSKETDASLEPSERKKALPALDVSPVPPVSDKFRTEIIIFHHFKPLNLWSFVTTAVGN